MAILLITRPIKKAEKDAQFFKAQGFDVVMAPMLDIQTLPFPDINWNEYDAIILTSANAVEPLSYAPAKPDIWVYCVGIQTAEALINLGFENVVVAEGKVNSLFETIAETEKNQGKSFLYLRGTHVSTDLKALLNEQNIDCDELCVYEAVKTDLISDSIIKRMHDQSVDAISFMSARSAENFVRLVRMNDLHESLESTKALCLSNSVLDCVRVLKWESTHVSPSTDGSVFRQFCTNILNKSEN